MGQSVKADMVTLSVFRERQKSSFWIFSKYYQYPTIHNPDQPNYKTNDNYILITLSHFNFHFFLDVMPKWNREMPFLHWKMNEQQFSSNKIRQNGFF